MIEELTKEFYSADGMTWPEYQNIVRKMYQEYGLGEEYIDWSEFKTLYGSYDVNNDGTWDSKDIWARFAVPTHICERSPITS